MTDRHSHLRTPVRHGGIVGVPGLQVFEVDGDALVFPAGAGPRGLAALAERGRVRLGLVLAARARPVDVSIQPGVVERAVLDAARSAEVPPEAAVRATLRWLAARSAAAGHPGVPLQAGLLAAAAAAPFPLLVEAFEAGAGPVREVPRWATGVLAAQRVRDGARVGLGVATRPVVAALASSLLPSSPGGPVRFGPLALALAAAPVLEPDQLARLLREATDGPIEGWPPPQTLAAIRRLCTRVGGRVAFGLLADAARRPDGFDHLALAVAADHSAAPSSGRPPARLEQFTADAVARMPADPRPLGGTPDDAGVRSARRRPRASSSRQRPRSARSRFEAGGPRVVGHTLGVHGHVVGELRLVEPRRAEELAVWGERLGNCLADYGGAWASGRSRLIGVERDGVLSYCLELTPSGTLRQFLAARNRPVPAADRATVLAALAALGVLARLPAAGVGEEALRAPR